MAAVKVNGQSYPLRFDLDAMEQIEDRFGGTREMLAEIKGSRGTKAVKQVFVILANNYREWAGLVPDLDESVLRHAELNVIRQIGSCIKEAMEEGMRSETAAGGKADDEVHDVFLEEIDREEKKS